MRSATGLFPIMLLATVLPAQQEQTFDAISIKRNLSGAESSETNTSPGRVNFMNVTPLSLLLRAFGVQESQIIGIPGWVSNERYDVIAVTVGAEQLGDKDRQPFLRAMLAERWKLRFHRETRQLPIYSLQVLRNGTKFAEHKGEGTYAMKVTPAGGLQVLRSTKGNIPRLVEILSRATGKIVVNETGLSGEYDFTLAWVQDLNSETAGPSLNTALEEQLGLRLTPSRHEVEVIVIDDMARPTAN